MPPRWTGIAFATAVAVAMTVAAQAASARPKAFDLVCGDTRYKIDLGKKQWCQGECDTPQRLHGIRRDTVTLANVDHVNLTYDRRRRTMTNSFDLAGTEGREVTPCEVFKFSGFPTAGRRVHPTP